jgi:hypothetical protein
MPRRLPLWWALALVLVLISPVSAQDPVASPSEQDIALQAWVRAAEPGPWHAFLARRAGTWQVAGRIWNDPEGEPALSTGTARLEMILGGRFLQEVLHGEAGGQEFSGLGLLGCDNASGTITALWVDSMGTRTSVLSGPAGQAGEPLELRGSMTDPAIDRGLNQRVVITFVSEDEQRWEYFGAPEGFEEMKMMELVYSRKR